MERTDREETSVGLDADGALEVTCYVRSDVSVASSRQIDVVIDRLQDLQETGLLADCSVTEWPSQHRTADAAGETREEVVAAFEEWAAGEGYSLEPAFRHQTVHSSLLGSGETWTEIRVPLVSLALFDETGTLHGVVPYTDDEGETHTVEEWLSTAEDRAAATTAQYEQTVSTPMEG